MTDGKRHADRGAEGKTLRVTYDGFRLFPSEEKGKLTATYSLNCSCADGVLQGGIGYELYRDRNGDFVQTAVIKDTRAFYILEGWSDGDGTEVISYYFLLTGDGQMYQYSSDDDIYVKQAQVGVDVGMATAIAPDGQTYVVLSGEQGAYRVKDLTWTPLEEVEAGKGTAAVCFSKNRIFLGEKPCKLLYGNPEQPWDFTSSYDEGGYVYLPFNKGDIVDMLEYGDCVYIFFQRGIVCLKPDGLARNFQVSEIPYSGGEIFGGSVGICENWIFFLSENGICRFDGKEVKRVGRYLNILPSRENQRCSHAAVGEYFVLQYFDELLYDTRTVALRADGKDGYFVSNYVGLNECNRMPICAVGNQFAVLKLGGELPKGEEYVFESAYLDLGGAGRKHLKSVTLYGEGCFEFSVMAGMDRMNFEIEDLPVKTTVKVGLCAEEFRLGFALDKGATVRKIVLEYERLD